MKTYILQEDLRNVKAGTEFTQNKNGTYSNGQDTYNYMRMFIERNPKWFKLKEEKGPPLGLMPRYLHDEKRFEEIRNAIKRFEDEGKIIPQEWIEEEQELIKRIKFKPTIADWYNDGTEMADGSLEGISFEFSNGIEPFYITKERLAEILIAESNGELFIDNPKDRTERGKRYTEKELLEAEEKAFNAAKQFIVVPVFRNIHSKNIESKEYLGEEFLSYSDYKNGINNGIIMEEKIKADIKDWANSK